jgi:hypothetical protein
MIYGHSITFLDTFHSIPAEQLRCFILFYHTIGSIVSLCVASLY